MASPTPENMTLSAQDLRLQFNGSGRHFEPDQE